MKFPFATLDVFTDRRFAGNPLAVVLEGQGLEADAMQAIAREFNHPETVFVFAPADPAHRARLRIFTPARELPFAGHPTVGTAVLLALSDRASADPIAARLRAAGFEPRVEEVTAPPTADYSPGTLGWRVRVDRLHALHRRR